MHRKSIPDLDYLNRRLSYDPTTGVFIWKAMRPDMHESGGRLSSEVRAECWNRRYEGKAAGRVDESGYVQISLKRVLYPAHRIAWKMHYGVEPPLVLDHINGSRSDNRIVNLRSADYTINARNRKLSANNRTGANGVDLKFGKYQASIRVRKKLIHLGTFASLDEAITARRDAEQRFGFHPTHGQR